MKLVLKIAILGMVLVPLALLSGCVTSNEFLMPNADFIDNSIIDATTRLDDLGIDKKKTIAIAELVSKPTDNSVPSALIYDALVQSLRNKGYNVVERDRDSIRLLAPEVGEDAFPVVAKYMGMGIERPAAWDAKVGSGSDSDMSGVLGGQNIIIFNKPANETDENEVIARLPKSDYLLLYRILEVGIRYGKTDNTKAGEITRRARVAFNYRVIHCSSSTVYKAGRIDATFDDDIPTSMKETLEKNLYIYYPHGHPDFLPATELPLNKKEFKGDSSSEKSGKKQKKGYYGFAAGITSLADDDTSDIMGDPYELTFEMLHNITGGVHLASDIGYGMGQKDTRGTKWDMWYVPVRISALYMFDVGTFKPFAGGGLFANYSEWSTEFDVPIGDISGDATYFGGQLHAGFKVSALYVNLRYLFGSSTELGGDYTGADTSMDGFHLNLGVLF